MVRAGAAGAEDFDAEVEEAAATLGAGACSASRRVMLPALAPALLTGFALAFARAVGEYGSVIFIAGNMPCVSEIAPLLIVIKLEQFDYAGAAAVGLAMLADLLRRPAADQRRSRCALARAAAGLMPIARSACRASRRLMLALAVAVTGRC